MSSNDDITPGKVIGCSALALIGILALCWFIQGSDFFLYRFFAPKYEQIRRDTFKQSQAYNDGMVTELQNMRFEYEQASENHKAALRSIILHRAASYDDSNMPSDLKAFIDRLKTQGDSHL